MIGAWKHHSVGEKFVGRKWLQTFSLGASTPTTPTAPDPLSPDNMLAFALQLATATLAENSAKRMVDQRVLLSESAVAHGLQWFVLPSEVVGQTMAPMPRGASLLAAAIPPGTVALLPFFKEQGGTADVSLLSAGQVVQDIAATDQATPVLDIDTSISELTTEFGALLDDDDDDEESGNAAKLKDAAARAALFPLVPKKLTDPIGAAIRDFDMIKAGDRVLIGLSGGKDSLSLLHALLAMQKRAPIKFEIAAVTMNPNFPGFNPEPLVPYMASLGVPYFFESQQLMGIATATNPSSICSWCSRMKRKWFCFCFLH
jgi:hypothetical protein